MKDITARLDTMMTIMEQREERLLAAMNQRDECVNLVEQALSRLSLILENNLNQLQDIVTTSTLVQPAVIREQHDCHAIPFAHMRTIRLDFPRFDGSDVLQWIYQAE